MKGVSINMSNYIFIKKTVQKVGLGGITDDMFKGESFKLEGFTYMHTKNACYLC